MKLIKPSFSILEQKPGLEGVLSHIELCGRTAYKSEDKITADSAPKFVEMLIKRGHGAVLEHGTIYLTLELDNSDREKIDKFYLRNKYTYPQLMQYDSPKNPLTSLITTNYRVLVENKILDHLQYQCEPKEDHMKRISVKFICDRGVSHEFVRHRVFSFVQESTRYCNYSSSKFGNELTFIIPSWLDITSGDYIGDHDEVTDITTFTSETGLISSERANKDGLFRWVHAMSLTQFEYLKLSGYGWSPQQARSVLPNSLKTELIMTGTIEQWEGFFKLRCAPDAHPQARELAIPLEEEFKKLNLI
jgi:thymidylate synthase (FAD)